MGTQFKYTDQSSLGYQQCYKTTLPVPSHHKRSDSLHHKYPHYTLKDIYDADSKTHLVTKILLKSQKSVPDPTHNIVTYSLHHTHILMPMVSMYLWKYSHVVSNPQLVKTKTNSRCNIALILPYLHCKIR